jgi:hypothetical protein
MSCRAISVLLVLCGAAWVRAQSLDEIIGRNFQARGGLDNIKSVHNQRISGRISFGQDAEGPLVVEMARPGRMRQEFTMDGKTIIQTTDGQKGWARTVPGEEEPRALSAGELKNMAGGADFDGPLVDYRARGNRVELEGKAKVDGRDAWKLRVTLKNGDVRNDYIDCESFLETKWEGRIESEGKIYQVESYFRDYRKVDGLTYAFRIESNTVGTQFHQVIQLEKVELNLPLDDSRFTRP